MYRWVDHTAEIELHVEAASRKELFAEAMQALAELLAERAAPGGDRARREVATSAPDLPTLLADWLTELAFLAESDGFVPEAAERLDVSDTDLEATVTGRLAAPSHLIKAVTYHRLEAQRADGGWRGRVVLDV